jgi:hypothetical protein
MKINTRIKKIERELQDQINIPNSERFIVSWPKDTEEEKEIKVKKLLEELKQKYGESVTQQDIITMNVIYDEQEKGELML